MYPSEELGSPSLALSVRVPDSNRPRQIEKPFRFLDLPAEIRNMIYEFTFSSYPIFWSADLLCSCEYDFAHHAYLSVMKRQFRLPSTASVNRCIREETMSLYFATTNFIWYWDPMRVHSEGGSLCLSDSIKILAHVLDFATTNGVQIKSITVCSPHDCHWDHYTLKDLANSVRFLAPLRKSIDLIGRAHPMLQELKFEDEDSFTRRVFDFSGTLKPSVLRHHMSLKQKLRLFLRNDLDGLEMLDMIEDIEYENWWWRWDKRREKREEMRKQNKAKELSRWTGVLRSRPHRG